MIAFSQGLRTVAFTGLGLMEVAIMRRMGKRYLLELGSRYRAQNGKAKQLQTRLDSYETAF